MIQPAVKSAVSSALTIASGADEMTAQTLPDKGFTAILARHSEAETDVAAALPAFDVGTPPPPIDLTGNLAGKTGGNSLPGELPDDAMDISLQDSETEEMHAEAGISPVPADGTLAIPILSIDRGRALRAVPTPTSSSTANPGSTSTPEPNVRATLGPADTLKPVARAADAAGKAAKQTDPKSAARPFPMTMRPLSAAAKSVTADSSRSAEMDSASKSSAKQTTGTDVRPIITLRIPQVERISGKANPLVIPARQIEARADISVTGLDQRLADGAKAAGQDVLAKDTEGKVDPAHKAPAGHPARSVVAKPDVEQPVTARPAAREIDGVQPRAAEPQPLLALREAQPGLPGAMARQSASPTSAAPAGPQDFAALIDRLVEARDAAAPQTVKASIAHDEFGHIALRFKQLDGNLSVSMKSADPGFTAAVQSASAAGQAAGSGENGANSSRHDGSQAQQGGAAFGQSQSNTQANAQGSTRDGNRGEPRSATGRSAQETGGTDHGENQQDASSGIYA